jgi:putative transposase
MWTEKDREKYKDDGRRYPSDLTDVEWSIIEPLIGVTLPSLPICARW